MCLSPYLRIGGGGSQGIGFYSILFYSILFYSIFYIIYSILGSKGMGSRAVLAQKWPFLALNCSF